MDITWYPAVKALHLIFMVSFFAGTFCIVRLFILHKETLAKFEPDRTILTRQLIGMERRLWYVVTWPSLVLMLILGLWLFAMDPALIKQPWMHAKLGLVALLIAYHLRNQAIVGRARDNDIRWSSLALRLWNMAAVVLLASAVFLAVLKDLRWEYGALGLVTLGATIVLTVMGYRRKGKGGAQPDQGNTTTRPPRASR